MIAPPSIRRFTLLWWAATAFWLIAMILSWKRTQATLAANPQTAAAADIAQALVIVVVLAVTALLWWLVARRASPAGKWLTIAVAAFSAAALAVRVVGQSGGGSLPSVALTAFLLGGILTVAAAAMLFSGEAAEWFGNVVTEDVV